MNYNDFDAFLNSYKTEYFDLRYFRDTYIHIVHKLLSRSHKFSNEISSINVSKITLLIKLKVDQIKISQCYKNQEKKKERKIEYDPFAINRIT